MEIHVMTGSGPGVFEFQDATFTVEVEAPINQEVIMAANELREYGIMVSIPEPEWHITSTQTVEDAINFIRGIEKNAKLRFEGKKAYVEYFYPRDFLLQEGYIIKMWAVNSAGIPVIVSAKLSSRAHWKRWVTEDDDLTPEERRQIQAWFESQQFEDYVKTLPMVQDEINLLKEKGLWRFDYISQV